MTAAHKVLFDTDPGVDDAMALFFALAHPEIELLGLCTTFGNVAVAQAAENALYLCQVARRSIPVTQGVASPWVIQGGPAPLHIHGADGLGNLPQREPITGELDPRASAQYIVDMARAQPGEINLVAVGPLGNLALALQLEPALPSLLRQVIVMGGAARCGGNVSPVAEANFWHDPHAADKVFSAGWKLSMVGLDVTQKLLLPLAVFERIAAYQQHPATDLLLHAVRFYTAFCSAQPFAAGREVCTAHDMLALAYLVRPELFTCASGRVRVATEGIAMGQSMFAPAQAIRYPQAGWAPPLPLTDVCLDVDAAACAALFESTLMTQWLPD